MAKKFLRRDTKRYSKLGKNRKKLQKWRKAKGRDSKIRLKRKGYPTKVSIGFKSSKKEVKPVPQVVKNMTDISKIEKNAVVILARVGARKKIEIIRIAEEKGINIINVGGKK